MTRARAPLLAPLFSFAERLRFPTLFWITLALFLIDVAIPDIVPFVDEVLLGLGTLLLTRFRRERGGAARRGSRL